MENYLQWLSKNMNRNRHLYWNTYHFCNRNVLIRRNKNWFWRIIWKGSKNWKSKKYCCRQHLSTFAQIFCQNRVRLIWVRIKVGISILLVGAILRRETHFIRWNTLIVLVLIFRCRRGLSKWPMFMAFNRSSRDSLRQLWKSLETRERGYWVVNRHQM